jgi:hypothetical protein
VENPKELTYLKAKPKDSKQLTSIAIRSKQYWGYPDSLMETFKTELTITTDYIKENIVYKIYFDKLLIGFYGLKLNPEYDCFEIDHFWLTPENIKRGFGKLIFQQIKYHLLSIKQSKTIVKSDPNAVGFYIKMKGKQIGHVQSKISGRLLPIFEFDLKTESTLRGGQ